MHDKMEQAQWMLSSHLRNHFMNLLGITSLQLLNRAMARKLEALNVTSAHYAEDCMKLCKFIMPELQIIWQAMQRPWCF